MLTLAPALTLWVVCLSAQNPKTPFQQVHAFVKDGHLIPPIELGFAKKAASEMFHAASVELMWHRGAPDPAPDCDSACRLNVVISFQRSKDSTPKGAMAYSYPYDSVGSVV